MLARRSGAPLSFVAATVAVAGIAAAGASLTSFASARENPACDDSAVPTVAAPGEPPLECVETATTATVTETRTVEEHPGEAPVEPPTVTTETTDAPSAPTTTAAATTVAHAAPTPAPAPVSPATATTTTSVADPQLQAAPPAPAATGSGIFGSGAWIGRPPQNGTPRLSGGPYVFPVLGPTSFGDSWAPRATVSWHHGIDIFAPLGAPVVAVADGVLFSVGWNTIGGRRLWLRDREGNYFYFAHLSGFSDAAVEGARVRAGTVIGYVGNTGDAEGTAYHLHFEIHPVSLLGLGYDGAVDPFTYVSSWPRYDRAPVSVAGTAAAGPPPGAILLGFRDIASVERLSARSLQETLEETLEEATVAAPVTALTAPGAAASGEEAIPAPSEEHARVARTLDSEASDPARRAAGVWDALAACESGGNWSARTGNGYLGGLQFLPQTWASGGGDAVAPSPHLATREQQIVVAERVLELQGWRAWPVCSTLLGLGTTAGN